MNWSDREWIEQQFALIQGQLTEILKEIKIMATTQQQFDALLKTMGDTITGEDSTLVTLLGLVQQIIAKAQGAGVDLTAEANQVGTITTDLQTQTSNINTAITAINTALNPPAAS